MKKNKIAAAFKNNINYKNVSVETIEALKAVQRIERERNLKLLPITDVNKLAVLYFCSDENGEIHNEYFDYINKDLIIPHVGAIMVLKGLSYALKLDHNSDTGGITVY